MDAFRDLVRRLQEVRTKFVVIGVRGANYYAASGSTLFTTQDRDLFLPQDAANLLEIWKACEEIGFSLVSSAGREPLGSPIDIDLAKRVAERKALTTATDEKGLDVDLTFVMPGFGFDDVWAKRRIFRIENVEVPVARLSHIVASKANANRPKDRLFLETHAEALKQLMSRD